MCEKKSLNQLIILSLIINKLLKGTVCFDNTLKNYNSFFDELINFLLQTDAQFKLKWPNSEINLSVKTWDDLDYVIYICKRKIYELNEIKKLMPRDVLRQWVQIMNWLKGEIQEIQIQKEQITLNDFVVTLYAAPDWFQSREWANFRYWLLSQGFGIKRVEIYIEKPLVEFIDISLSVQKFKTHWNLCKSQRIQEAIQNKEVKYFMKIKTDVSEFSVDDRKCLHGLDSFVNVKIETLSWINSVRYHEIMGYLNSNELLFELYWKSLQEFLSCQGEESGEDKLVVVLFSYKDAKEKGCIGKILGKVQVQNESHSCDCGCDGKCKVCKCGGACK